MVYEWGCSFVPLPGRCSTSSATEQNQGSTHRGVGASRGSSSWTLPLHFRALLVVLCVVLTSPLRAAALWVDSPAPIAGLYLHLTAAFGPSPGSFHLENKTLAIASPLNGCTQLADSNVSYVGSIVLIVRGGCSFLAKAKNAQDAGAEAVVIANNIEDDNRLVKMAPSNSESNNAIKIPSVFVDWTTGNEIVTAGGASFSQQELAASSLLPSRPIRKLSPDALEDQAPVHDSTDFLAPLPRTLPAAKMGSIGTYVAGVVHDTLARWGAVPAMNRPHGAGPVRALPPQLPSGTDSPGGSGGGAWRWVRLTRLVAQQRQRELRRRQRQRLQQTVGRVLASLDDRGEVPWFDPNLEGGITSFASVSLFALSFLLCGMVMLRFFRRRRQHYVHIERRNNAARAIPVVSYHGNSSEPRDEVSAELLSSATHVSSFDSQAQIASNHYVHNETCSICLEEFSDNEPIKVLPCQHGYHAACIDPWLLQRSDKCPLCKQSILPQDTD